VTKIEGPKKPKPVSIPPFDMSVATPTTFNLSSISFSEMKKLDNGSYAIYVNCATGPDRKLRIQGPQMPLPYKASDYQGNGKFSVSQSFRDEATNPKVKSFRKMVESIDAFVLNEVTKNAGKYLGIEGASKEMVKLFFTPSIHFAKDKVTKKVRTDLPPTFQGKLNQKNGAFDAEMYDKDLKPVKGEDGKLLSPLQILQQNAEFTGIFECGGIWIIDKKFGVTWRLHSAWMNVSTGVSASGPSFVSEDGNTLVISEGLSAEEEAGVLSAVAPDEEGEAEAEEDAEEEEAEEEEAEVQEEEAVVAPPPLPVKVTPAPVVVTPAPVAAAPATATATKKVPKKTAATAAR
jgi:hypothetical protein